MNNYITRKRLFGEIYQNKHKIINSKNKHIGIQSNYYETIKQYETDNEYLLETLSNSISCNCPHCNNISTSKHDKKVVYPIVGVLNNKQIIMKLTKNRFFCKHCKKTFVEPTLDIEFKNQISKTVKDTVIKNIISGQTYTSSSRLSKISISSVIRVFDRHHVRSVNYTKVKNIMIDELRLMSNKRSFQFVVIDADSKKILDILKTRNQKDVLKYLINNFTVGDLQTVTMDLWTPYKNAVHKFNQYTNKDVKIIADKFHFVRQLMWDLDEIRIQEYDKFKEHKEDYNKIKSISKILRKRKNKISNFGKDRLNKAFELSSRLHRAYQFKESYLELVKHCQSKEYFTKEINEWIKTVQKTNINGFNRTISSHNNWIEEISNAFKYDYSNGYIEGANQKMKLAKNKAFGFSNIKRTEKLMKLQIGNRKVV